MYHFYSFNQARIGFVFTVDAQQAEAQSTTNANHSPEFVHSSPQINYFSCLTAFMKKKQSSKLDY